MFDFKAVTDFDSLNYDDLKSTCSACDRCGLAATRTNVVVGTGPVPCNLMIIGEGPGEQEDLHAKPFIGRAGQLLTKILESVGINREKDVFITNIVKCRPPGNRDPKLEEIESCKDYLIRQIQLIQPKVLILLGSPALKTVLEEKLSISKVRGNWYQAEVPYMEEPLNIMPLFHPSYLLRNASREKGSPKWLTWKDMLEVKLAIDYYNASNA